MNVAVVGSRTFDDYKLLKTTLDKLKIQKIISGGAIGADKLGARYAKEHKIETLICKPDWSKYGKSAGIIRNKDIIENCDVAVAFWDGKSTGTLSSINLAKKLNKKITIIKF